jgi:hypothetical protein
MPVDARPQHGGETLARKIYRYTVRIDDRWHDLLLSGPVLHVGRPSCAGQLPTRDVELWAEYDSDDAQPRRFRVYGTGQPIEEPCQYVGTAFDADGALVWHLMERTG